MTGSELIAVLQARPLTLAQPVMVLNGENEVSVIGVLPDNLGRVLLILGSQEPKE